MDFVRWFPVAFLDNCTLLWQWVPRLNHHTTVPLSALLPSMADLQGIPHNKSWDFFTWDWDLFWIILTHSFECYRALVRSAAKVERVDGTHRQRVIPTVVCHNNQPLTVVLVPAQGNNIAVQRWGIASFYELSSHTLKCGSMIILCDMWCFFDTVQ